MTTLTLTIDERERARIPAIMENMVPLGISAEVKTLEVADYILSGDGVVPSAFEFKTIPDIIASIMDGRVFQQTRELDLNFPGQCYLVICGNLQEARYSRPEWRYDPKKWNGIEASYRGAILSILESDRVRVIMVKDVAEFCSWLVAKAKRLQRGDKKGERPIATLKSADRSAVMEAEDVLCAVSGIGRAAARGLLAHFGSIEAIVAADPKELSKAPEIGKVRAEHLVEVLRGKHVVTI